MEMKINKNIYLKLIAVLLCIYIAISPFCQPKKVYANPVLLGGIAITLIAGMIAAGYARDAVVPAERLNELNEQATANLQSAFPDPAEYNQQLGILENLSNDLLAGKDVDWSKYSGKAIYAISKAVIDVLYPYNYDVNIDRYNFIGAYGDYALFNYNLYLVNRNYFYLAPGYDQTGGKYRFNYSPPDTGMYANNNPVFKIAYRRISEYTMYMNCGRNNNGNGTLAGEGFLYIDKSKDTEMAAAYILGILPGKNIQNVPNVNTKIANKVKLPTRLPPSVINNYNTYINGESENLTINPTADELPQLPDNYNPVTDDPPDLDGFQDVTPDQEPTDTPDPTPTPTPTPSTPEYDGSDWVKRIGDFFDGLLTFLKGALVPTQTINGAPLQNMGTDFSKKFPFSLPGDIVKLYGLLQADPRRPEFHMTFDLSKVGVPGEPIVWDIKLEEWDGAAAIVKTALYIGFLIGLAFISKNFIRN